MEVYEDKEIKEVEYLILLILGKSGGKISILHLQKIFFFLWKFHPQVKKLVEFVPHLKGPFSSDIEDIIKNPCYLDDCWEYIPPNKTSKEEKIKGGYLEITQEGKNKYNKLLIELTKLAQENEEVSHIILAINLVVPLYTRLEWDELLLLLYTDENNKKFSEKSELSNSILNNSEKIIDHLIKKGILPKEKKEVMIKRVKKAVWLK